jgi:hypothetical protein
VLEDLNMIDIVTHEPGKWIKFVIIDSGVTKRDNSDRHLSLLNHKIDVCLAHLEDEQRFAEFGKPAEVVIEVRCAYPVASPTPIPRSVLYPSGRAMDYCIKFVDRTK